MNQFDVIVIGSGLGGLVAGTILSKHQYHVCVVEKNEQFGGALQIFKRDHTILDTGVHYIGSLNESENLYQYFKYLGLMDKLKLKQLDNTGFDRISFEGDSTIYSLANSYETFKKNLLDYFPEEEYAIDCYIEKIKQTCKSVSLYNLEVPEMIDFSAEYYNLNIYEYLQSITSNEKLIAVLLGNNMLYYADKEKTPMYVHALIVNSYISSAWRCIGGGQQIANILVRNIRNHGGTVLRNHEVVHINTQENKAISVELKNGQTLLAKHFISNINPSFTFDLMDSNLLKNSYKKRITGIENTMSAFTMHLVLKEKSFLYFNHNRYHFTSDNIWCNADYDIDKWPENLLFFTPANDRQDDYAESLGIMCAMKFDEVDQWKNSFHTSNESAQRDESYYQWKSEKEERVLKIAFQLFPALKDNIVSIHSSTPLTYRDYLNTKEGSAYGSKKNHQNPLESYISPRTKVDKLYFTGQDINLHGIMGVTLSAFVTCASFINMDDLLNEVKEA